MRIPFQIVQSILQKLSCPDPRTEVLKMFSSNGLTTLGSLILGHPFLHIPFPPFRQSAQ
jgi:hypothetical protein